ncbi:Transposase [Cordylochernes scorpioides]|uniref:Transposase n=1 Tax=Cordylochernes scorpioides TaxID=51811 RepID=A0ABY6LBG8_9ARAC|nr:Transposase [Cordylochernes scorpioides]
MAVAAPEYTLSTIQRVTGTQVSKLTINRRLRERNLFRLQWCRELSTWNCADWGRIVFSYESRFLLCPDDRRKRVWRRPGQRVDPGLTVEHHTGPQQGVMVWGAISFDNRTPLVVIPGTLTAQRRLQPSRNVDYLARQLETIWQEISQHTIRNLYQSMTRRVAACIQARASRTHTKRKFLEAIASMKDPASISGILQMDLEGEIHAKGPRGQRQREYIDDVKQWTGRRTYEEMRRMAGNWEVVLATKESDPPALKELYLWKRSLQDYLSK